jgi:hypothetical protein
VDIMVIYALTAHGHELRTSTEGTYTTGAR